MSAKNFLNSIESVNSPIIYITLAIISSSICYGIYTKNTWLALFCAGLFFVFVTILSNYKFALVIFLFFIMNILINLNYYNINIPKNFEGKVRIEQNSVYSTIGSFRGRKVLLDGKNLNFNQGDIVNISGSFKSQTDSEKGIIGVISVNSIKNVETDMYAKVLSVRKLLYDMIKDDIGSRRAGLVCSLSYGYTDYLDSEDKTEMKNLGIIHAISVSGLHVALIFMILSKIFSKKISLIISFIYILFTGAVFSAIRAFLMQLLSEGAFSFKKKHSRISGVLLSGAIITLFKPYAPFDLGFQLSYLATAGIILFSDKLNRKFYKMPKILAECFAVTIASQVFTLPILIISFNQIAVTSFIGNLLIVPILNGVIILGNLLILVIKVPQMFDFICYILKEIIGLVDYITDKIDSVNINLSVNDCFAVLYIVILISFYFAFNGYKKLIPAAFISIIIVSVYNYSPVTRVDYIKEGGLAISYKGENKIITPKKSIKASKIMGEYMASEVYTEVINVQINKDFKISTEGNKLLLITGEDKHTIKMNKLDTISENYDIIDFASGEIKGFYVINGRIFRY